MKRLLLILMAVVLAACESMPVRDMDANSWESHQQRLAQLDSWSLSGRLAIHYDNEGGQGILYWQQDHERYQLKMLDPLGRQLMQITGDEQHALMRTREGESFESESAESLMQAYLGWSVPVLTLNQWVRGMPGTGLTIDESVIEQGRLTLLVQEGWRIEYQAYEEVDQLWLPSKLRIMAPHLNLKLIVEQWKLS